MRLNRFAAFAVLVFSLPLLSGCSLLIPPSGSDLAGTYIHSDTYAGTDTTLVVNSDGTCSVTNYPVEISADDNEDAMISTEHFDANCSWSVNELLFSGAWSMDFITDPSGENVLNLDWHQPIGGQRCFGQSVGDPDSDKWWNLCSVTP